MAKKGGKNSQITTHVNINKNETKKVTVYIY